MRLGIAGAVGMTLLMAGPGWAQEPAAPAEASQKLAIDATARQELAITVYNNNYGLVREVRDATLPKGVLELEFRDVAETIEASSVAFKSLTFPGDVAILEQNYRYDLLSPQKLLERFVGKPVQYTTMQQKDGADVAVTRDGVLLSINEGQIVRFGDSIMINPPGNVTLPEAPKDLLSRPTLVWMLNNLKPEPQKIEVSYLANGMTWMADYVAVLNEADTQLDLTGWVTVENRTGASYGNANLKLVAGGVARAPQPMDQALVRAAAAPMAEAKQFEEKGFFEYHLYTLQRPTDLANNETKQIKLLEGQGVGVTKIYVSENAPVMYRGGGQAWRDFRNATVTLEFQNSEANHLGMPLPGGRFRAYKADTDGSLQFVGEQPIQHTPKDEKVRMRLGDAFDVVVESSTMDYKKLSDRAAELSFQHLIRNHKKTAVEVLVREPMQGEWEILKSTHPHEKKDQHTAEFKVPAPADGEGKLQYTVRMVW